MTTEKSKLLFLVLILLGISWLVGCGAQPTARPTAVQLSPTAASPSTITPSETPAETASVEPSPTAPPYTRCQEIIDAQLPKDFLTEGSIIFDGECEGREGLFRLSADTRRIEPFLDGMDDPDYPFLQVSRDSQWLALVSFQHDTSNNLMDYLIVTGEDDNLAIRYPMNRGWMGFSMGWLRNGFLNFWSVGDKIEMLDPFTGKISIFHYPKPDDINIDIDWISFDNALARQVYIGPGLHYQLREISSGRILYISESRYSWNTPQWSPSGAFFSFPAQEDNSNSFKFVAVDRNGKPTTTEETFYANGYINFDWSSKGKYLSILTTNEQGKSQIVFWNPEKNQVTRPNLSTQYDFGLPVFSPDEQRFVVLAMEDSSQDFGAINYVGDVLSGKMIQLDISLRPIAWLKTNYSITKPKNEPYPLPPKSGKNVKQVCLQSQAAIVAPEFNGGLVFVQNEYLSVYTSNQDINRLAKTDLALVSPNQKWLFYWYNEPPDYQPRFWLHSLNEQPAEINPRQRIYFEYLNRAVFGWAGNSELWVDSDYSNQFNPFNNMFQKSPEFQHPDYGGCLSSSCPNWNLFASEFYLIYDTNYERHVFFSGWNYPDGYLMMSDRNAKILWDIYRPFVGFNMPKWQPGDQKLAIPMPKDEKDDWGDSYEIFTIDRDGHQRQLTDYSAAYPTMNIDKFSWSPDGRYIAFWGDTHSQEKITQQHPYRLFVLDTVTRQTVDYCVTGNYSRYYAQNPAPVWSPDGTQIAVQSIQSGERMILMVDFASGTVSPVAEGELIGWMAEP